MNVSIGQAAALYDLAPSTLRWWEQQRVLPEPPRVNGRRVYDETELRRIGLAYLCCVTGAMPLDQTAVVTSAIRDRNWQNTVREHADVLAAKIAELQNAHEYLLHLMQCPDDDVIGKCPNLDHELMCHTPRRHAPAPSLVAAAQSIPRHASGRRGRDETVLSRDETTVDRCPVCGGQVTRLPRGRRRTFCSRACQQRHHRRQNRR